MADQAVGEAEEIAQLSFRLAATETPQAFHQVKETMGGQGVLMVLLGQLAAVVVVRLLRQQMWHLPLLLLEMVEQEQHLLLLVRL
jgi:hypothetical protein